MKTKLPAAIAILLALGMPGWAHRLDEYLQATIISIEKDRLQASIRLIPGIAVSRIVLASIDRNADGVISVDEQRAYAQRVLHDLSLSLDGQPLTARLVSAHFSKIEEMKDGVGEMQIEFEADLPRRGTNRKLVFENHHLSGISAYLANCIMPRDRDIRVTAQNRNENQSFYAVDIRKVSLVSVRRPQGCPAHSAASRICFCSRCSCPQHYLPGHSPRGKQLMWRAPGACKERSQSATISRQPGD
jgi:hypothetical protein